MKVVGINGSPRQNGNTAICIRAVFSELEKYGIETAFVQLGGNPIRGCMACYACKKNKDKACVIKDDMVNECIGKMAAADAIILGTPTYFADVTSEIKALIDRAGFVAGANDNMFKRKIGAAVIAVRRGGAIHALDTINHFFHLRQMITVGASYWNMVYGLNIGDVENDAEGMQNMQVLGENMAWLLHKINK